MQADTQKKYLRLLGFRHCRGQRRVHDRLDPVHQVHPDEQEPLLICSCLPLYLLSKPEKYLTVYAANRFVPGAFTEINGWVCGRGAAKKIFREIGKRKNLMETLNYSNVTNNGIINTWKGKERKRPMYKGRVVVIIDERAMSKYEIAALAIRKSPNAIVIGSGTVGANGGAARATLPGQLEVSLDRKSHV